MCLMTWGSRWGTGAGAMVAVQRVKECQIWVSDKAQTRRNAASSVTEVPISLF